MSNKARKVYDETNPITFAEYCCGEDVYYFVDLAGYSRSGLTFEEAEEFLEDNAWKEEEN